jgi:glycosyltransferase involved in cell wall biosynthesis
MEEAQAGIFVEPENAADLVEAVTQLLADPGLRETLGRNGRRHVLQHFSRKHTARAYMEVLEGLVDKDLRRRLVAA